MILSRIAAITIITITATLLTGCQDAQITSEQDAQLAQCQQENVDLTQKIEQQKQALSKSEMMILNSVKMTSEILIENEELRKQNIELTKALKNLKKAKAQTPEEKAKIQKGLQQLFELQRKSAEKMKKDAQK